MDEKAKARINHNINRDFAHSVIDRILKREPVLYFVPDNNQWAIKTDSGGSFNCFSMSEALQELATHGIRRVEMEFDGFELAHAAVTLTKKEVGAIDKYLSEHWTEFTKVLQAEGSFSEEDLDVLDQKFLVARNS